MHLSNVIYPSLVWADAGKNLGQEKGTTEDETVRWHHRLNVPEFVRCFVKPELEYLLQKSVI